MARTPAAKADEQYSEEEAERRFIAAVNAGLNTKPKPLKSMTPKGAPRNRRSAEKDQQRRLNR
jgi:hypothetical protein